mmetsp:Transcript_26173/g.42896  ORF Transcript_26173/g.42896 Transcript_26173/m.42896 type:complete len:213 (+) Transcript_26173:1293-1931(+)
MRHVRQALDSQQLVIEGEAHRVGHRIRQQHRRHYMKDMMNLASDLQNNHCNGNGVGDTCTERRRTCNSIDSRDLQNEVREKGLHQFPVQPSNAGTCCEDRNKNSTRYGQGIGECCQQKPKQNKHQQDEVKICGVLGFGKGQVGPRRQPVLGEQLAHVQLVLVPDEVIKGEGKQGGDGCHSHRVPVGVLPVLQAASPPPQPPSSVCGGRVGCC